MRITQNSMNRTQLAGLNTSLERLQKTQEQLTSGKRLNRPSDSPIDTVTAMRLRDEQRTLEQLGENISDGVARLRSADDALMRVPPMLARIRTLTVAAANGTNGPGQRDAYAQEVVQIKDAIRQVANTQYLGRPIFAGTANVENAYDANGAYVGNDADVLRKVSDADGAAGDMNVAIPGSQLFGAPGSAEDLLMSNGVIDRVLTAMQTGDFAGMQTGLSELDDAQDRLLTAQSRIGARVNRLEGLQVLNGRQDDSAKISLSKVEDVDFIKAAMDLNIQSNAYNAALQASAKIIQPSLMDFLR